MYDSFLNTMSDKGHSVTQNGHGESLVPKQVVEHN